MEVDFIIVGHGIAGISVYEHLIKHNQRCLVINEEMKFSSSKVAAGLYNPVTGRKMKQTWMADELFPYLISFYKSLEDKLGGEFIIDQKIYRPFGSIEDQNDWLARENKNDKYVENTFTSSQFAEFINDPFGGILLNHSGYMNLRGMIEQHKQYLMQQNCYLNERFKYEELKINDGEYIYDKIKSSNIIFCDGPLANNNFFNWVPTAPVKGELLHIKISKPLPENLIFNKGVFIVKSLEGDYYRVGSTYEWQNLNTEPTDKARKQLIHKLDDLLKGSYEIVDQVAGVRPATKDRRPIIGEHPVLKKMYLFNGLGTKGVSLAPYFAMNFVKSIFNEEEMHDEVNINRYYSLYSSERIYEK